MADIRKLESELWEAADDLRANSKLTSQQYCMPVLGLIFLRYAWGRFKRADEQIDAERAALTGRKPPKETADYTAKGAMFIPEEARYDHLLNLPDGEDTGKAVNKAMASIAAMNPSLSGVLPDTYTELGNDLLRSVIRIFNNPALDEEGDDIIGRIYEYFLGKFAPAVASDDGVFFTPKSLVRMIMNVIEPSRGKMLDPACGSGGMFVSASDYVRENGGNPAESMMFYGQEKVDYNAKLCLMNMAVHGMQGNIKSGDEANTFYNDAHALDGVEDFAAAHEAMLGAIDEQKAAAKAEVEALPKREQKKRREALTEVTAQMEAAATEIGEAVWLVEKFGEGEYADVPGLCKVATRADIQGDQSAEKSSWSLTPGAYVGVPPVEDDGVDFHERMAEIQQELVELQAQSNDLMATITRNFEELGL